MKLKLTKIKVGNIHKVLVIDDDKTKYEDRMLAFFEASSQGMALIYALEFCRAIQNSSPETVWN